MITRVLVLYTGGTIGMAPKDDNDPYSPLAPRPLEGLLQAVPAFKHRPAGSYRSAAARQLAEQNVPFLELPNGNIVQLSSATLEPVDSSSITPQHWRDMAEVIRREYPNHDGFVILHGTDTMAYTASALSFMLENLAKPVILTGSQLPMAADRSDALSNLLNAVYVAGYRATDLPSIAEVAIVFGDRILRGCRASKMSTENWAGFATPNYPPLGRIGEHIKINAHYLRPVPVDNPPLRVNGNLDENVFSVSLFPGMPLQPLEKLLLDETLHGIVVQAYGTGNMPADPRLLDLIGRAVREQNKLVVNMSQCPNGMVAMGQYEASSDLPELGVLSGFDLTPEAAITKLMWILGRRAGADCRREMHICQRGEQSESLFELHFGGVAEHAPAALYTHVVLPDSRLDRNGIARAVLRISRLGVVAAQEGDIVRVRAYMNTPVTKHATPMEIERCVADIQFKYEPSHPVHTRMQNITDKTQNAIGNGDVSLTLLAERKPAGSDADWEPATMFFEGLYVALYAKA